MSAASNRNPWNPPGRETLRVARAAGVSAITILLLATACGGNARRPAAEPRQLSAGEAGELWRARTGSDGFVLLDIRTPPEFQAERIPGAVNIDFHASTFRDEVSRLDREKTILLYCRSGNRSSQSLPLFRALGFKDVRHLQGGILSWKKAGLPLEPAPIR